MSLWSLHKSHGDYSAVLWPLKRGFCAASGGILAWQVPQLQDTNVACHLSRGLAESILSVISGSCGGIWRWQLSGILRRVVSYKWTDVSDVITDSIIRETSVHFHESTQRNILEGCRLWEYYYVLNQQWVRKVVTVPQVSRKKGV
jgi:hypothetical protein